MSRRTATGVLTALLSVTLLAVPLRADAWTTADGRIETIAIADAAVPAERVVDAEVDVRVVRGDELDTANGALAHSHCDGCETVAVALQVVVLSANEDVDIKAENEALAVNEECADCRSLAAAHQFVVVTPGYARLGREGREKVRAIRAELRRLLANPAPLDQLEAAVAQLAQRLQQGVLDDLQAIGPRRSGWSRGPRVARHEEETRHRGQGWWHGRAAS